MASDRIVSIAKDQEGSRFIQQRLECADQDEIQLVFDEAIAAIEGNYGALVLHLQLFCLYLITPLFDPTPLNTTPLFDPTPLSRPME
jgi:hypothetical protein